MQAAAETGHFSTRPHDDGRPVFNGVPRAGFEKTGSSPAMTDCMFKNNYIIQTVSNALDLLEQFKDGTTELGLTDLSRRLNLQKNNVFRLVATLESRHYINLNNLTGKYRLGLRARVLGQVALMQTDFLCHSRPALNSLRNQCHETCYFSILADSCSYYVDGIESDLPVRVAHRIGSRKPLYCTATGKVFLAFMAPEDRDRFLDGPEAMPLTAGTIINRDQLCEELHLIAQQGFAIEDQEHDLGVVEIAVPVFDFNGSVVAALSISGPAMRLDRSRMAGELKALLLSEATRLSDKLGLRQEPEHPGSNSGHVKISAIALPLRKDLRKGKKPIIN
jgi:DNA-binding IclR family transcriptional regulator